MKITQNGIVEAIGAPVNNSYQGKSYQTQQLILLVPGFVNQFGEKKSKDEYWEYTAVGDENVRNCNLSQFKPGDKVTVDGYLNSQSYKVETANPYTYKIRLAAIKLYQR